MCFAKVKSLGLISLMGLGLLLMGCTNAQAPNTTSPSTTSGVTTPESTVSTPASAKPASSSFAQALPVGAMTVLGGKTVELEVTRSPEEQALGLMYRENLPDDRGMLFSFNPARTVRFWMKNVVIPLDMVFLYQGKIVGIEADVPPCTSEPCATYGPGGWVDQVIELRGGRAARVGPQGGRSRRDQNAVGGNP